MAMLEAKEANASQAEEYDFLHHDTDSASPVQRHCKVVRRFVETK